MNISSDVQAGVALLDERYPYANWASLLDLDVLDMASHYDCVLGQLYGAYRFGLTALGLEWGSAYGFTFGAFGAGDVMTHDELTVQWRHVVRARLAQTAQ